MLGLEALSQGALTLFTVVVTVLLTFFTTRSSERRRWEREYSVRWDSRRQEALSKYASATKRVLTLSWDVAKSRGLGTSISPIPVDIGVPLIEAAEKERENSFEGILLLASGQTRELGRIWHGYAWVFADIAKGAIDISHEDFLELRDRCFSARDDYYASARAELGLDDGIDKSPTVRDVRETSARQVLAQILGDAPK